MTDVSSWADFKLGGYNVASAKIIYWFLGFVIKTRY